MTDQLKILSDIMSINGDLHELFTAHRGFIDWPENSITILKRDHLLGAIKRFQEGTLSASDLELWADFLEMNDFLDYEEDFCEQIANVLFQLATPEINQDITIELCSDLIGELLNTQ